jgi:hypothetical protein
VCLGLTAALPGALAPLSADMPSPVCLKVILRTKSTSTKYYLSTLQRPYILVIQLRKHRDAFHYDTDLLNPTFYFVSADIAQD